MPRPSYRDDGASPRTRAAIALGNDNRLTFGEHACLWRADAGHVADGVHVGEGGLERERDRREPSRRPSFLPARRPAERSASGPRGTGRRAAQPRRRGGPRSRGRIERRAPVSGDATRCSRSANAARSASDAAGEGGIGTGNGMTSAISDRCRTPRLTRWSCIRSAVSLGAGGHLNGVEVTATITRPPAKLASTSRNANAPFLRVELVPALDEPGCRARARGRRRARRRGCRPRTHRRRSQPASRPDRSTVDVRLHEAHARLDEVAVAMTDSRWDRPPEHHFELGEAEHERVGAIDQHDVDVGRRTRRTVAS